VNALAKAFRWAARQPDLWTRERWRRFVFGTIAKFEHGPDGFTQARRRLRATEELLGRIHREREAAMMVYLLPKRRSLSSRHIHFKTEFGFIPSMSQSSRNSSGHHPALPGF